MSVLVVSVIAPRALILAYMCRSQPASSVDQFYLIHVLGRYLVEKYRERAQRVLRTVLYRTACILHYCRHCQQYVIVHAAYAQDPHSCLLANDRQELQKSHVVDCCDRQVPSIAIVKALGRNNGRASQRSRRVMIINCAYKVFFWPCFPPSANAGKGPADPRPLLHAGVQGRAAQSRTAVSQHWLTNRSVWWSTGFLHRLQPEYY